MDSRELGKGVHTVISKSFFKVAMQTGCDGRTMSAEQQVSSPVGAGEHSGQEMPQSQADGTFYSNVQFIWAILGE